MTIEEIRQAIVKPATRFVTGGFRPTNALEESWIGKVSAFGTGETVPTDEQGEQMIPLAQLYLPNLPYLHPLLGATKLITVFIADQLPEVFEAMGRRWVLREYTTLASVRLQDTNEKASPLNPFPLRAERVDDYPLWEDSGLSRTTVDAILALERSGSIGSYYDIIEHSYEHKIGGYPSYCQSGVDFGEQVEFVFQISSDGKANFNVIDNGSLMFAKHTVTGEWSIYYDFY